MRFDFCTQYHTHNKYTANRMFADEKNKGNEGEHGASGGEDNEGDHSNSEAGDRGVVLDGSDYDGACGDSDERDHITLSPW